jgi:hypothetical protein
MMSLDCPAYLDSGGAVRCGLPAEVSCRFIMCSTSGPLDSAMIRCPAGHYVNGPIESLTRAGAGHHDPGTAGPVSHAGRDSLRHGHDGRRPPAQSEAHGTPCRFLSPPAPSARESDQLTQTRGLISAAAPPLAASIPADHVSLHTANHERTST